MSRIPHPAISHVIRIPIIIFEPRLDWGKPIVLISRVFDLRNIINDALFHVSTTEKVTWVSSLSLKWESHFPVTIAS